MTLLYEPSPQDLSIVLPKCVPRLVARSYMKENGQVVNLLKHHGSKTLVRDYSGYANHGILTNAVWTDGIWGWALRYNGLNTDVLIPNSPSLNFTAGVSVEAWINPTIVNNWSQASVAGQFEVGAYKWKIGINNVAEVRLDVYNTQISITSALRGVVVAGVWQHIAGTYDGVNAYAYLNGVQSLAFPYGLPLQNVANPVRVGYEPVNGRYFDGLIGLVKVYDRALSQQELQNHFWATRGLFGV